MSKLNGEIWLIHEICEGIAKCSWSDGRWGLRGENIALISVEILDRFEFVGIV